MKVAIYLTDNNDSIRQLLTDIGIHVCPCSKLEEAKWLCYYYREPIGCNPGRKEVHGIYDQYGEERTISQEAVHNEYIQANIREGRVLVECNSVDEFINAIKAQNNE